MEGAMCPLTVRTGQTQRAGSHLRARGRISQSEILMICLQVLKTHTKVMKETAGKEITADKRREQMQDVHGIMNLVIYQH